MNGFLSLLASNVFNTLGFLGLRDFTHGYQDFLCTVFWGYAICGFAPFLYFKMWKKLSMDSLWFFPWATSLVVIYYLFLNYPGTVSFSQLVVIRSMVPTLALAVRVLLKMEKVSTSDWKNIFPLFFLFLIAAFLWKPGSNVYALLALAFCFFIAQLSGRKFATYPRKEALLLLNTATFLLLAFWMGVEKIPLLKVHELGWFMILGFAAILCLVQFCFLYGIAHSPPVLSVLGISSSVPIGILLEALFLKNMPQLFICFCLVAYMASVAWISYSMRSKSVEAAK